MAVHIAAWPSYQRKGSFIMYYINMANMFLDAEGRDELEDDERSMMYINFIPIKWMLGFVTSRSKKKLYYLNEHV